MAFCGNCGAKLLEGAKFCQKCGSPTAANSQRKTEREHEYYGKIYKCPSCGEPLDSFVSRCPACGLELRGAKATSSVREFALKLEAIESQRGRIKRSGFFAKLTQTKQISVIDEQKISLIKNFSVPNTKEDILEFMILATSNIDTSVFGAFETPDDAKAMAEAWNAKIKQVYEKAKNTCGSDPGFPRIQELYDSCHADMAKKKRKKTVKWVLFIGWLPLLWAVIIISLIITGPKDEAKEIARLEAIIVDVQEALDRKEYKLALNIADSIDYQRSDNEMERKWDIQREYWIDKVLDEAASNGVELEYVTSEDADEANKDPSKSIYDAFFEGYNDGLQSAQESD